MGAWLNPSRPLPPYRRRRPNSNRHSIETEKMVLINLDLQTENAYILGAINTGTRIGITGHRDNTHSLGLIALGGLSVWGCNMSHAARPVMDRFWEKVDRFSNPSGCWEWMAAKTQWGYGVLRTNNRNMHSHRVSWGLHFGTVPEGLCVLHKCDNRGCVRPDHLFLGTYRDNLHDMLVKGRSNYARGEKAGQAKLKEHEVCKIRKMRGSMSAREIGEMFGVSGSAIAGIFSERSWAWLE